MTVTTTTPILPTQAPAEPRADDAATVWAFQCRACPTSTPDHVAAAVHSLNPGHVLEYAPSGTVGP